MPPPNGPAPTVVPRPPVGVACALIAGAAVAAYCRGFAGMLTYDDLPAIVHNPTIRHLFPLARVLRPLGGGTTVSGRPLLNLSLAINFAISGLHTWSYHAVNLAIHILAAWTLYGILRRAGPTAGRGGFFAFAVALLWAVHPLQSQAVMYVVQRAESLMALFYLLTLYCFIRGVGPSAGRAWLALSVLACLAGVGTKEVIVSAPVVVLAYDRTFVSGSFGRALRRRWGYYLALALTWIPLGWLVAVTGGDRGGTSGFDVGIRWPAYWLTQFRAIATYLRLSVWPHPLVFEYGPFWEPHPVKVLPYAAVVIAVAVATTWAWVRRPALGFLGVVFFAVLAPTSIMPGTRQMIVEHRMYLPLAAVLTALALATAELLRRAGPWARRPAVRSSALAALAIAGIAATARRVEFYRSDLVLWSDTAAKRPNNPYALYDLGFILFQRGRAAEAGAYYDRVLALDPNYADVRVDLGNALFRQGRVAEAAEQFEAALRINPRFPEAHNNEGNVLAAQGRYAEAVAQYREALRLQPDYPEALHNLGLALAALGRPEDAAACYRRALDLDPDYAAAHANLGRILAESGRLDDAIAEFREAVRLDPALAEAHHNLGAALYQEHKAASALPEFEAAVRLRPGFAPGHNELGGIYAELGRYADAREQFEAALKLDPDLSAARRNLERVDQLLGR